MGVAVDISKGLEHIVITTKLDGRFLSIVSVLNTAPVTVGFNANYFFIYMNNTEHCFNTESALMTFHDEEVSVPEFIRILEQSLNIKELRIYKEIQQLIDNESTS
jgi:hypothetical protein